VSRVADSSSADGAEIDSPRRKGLGEGRHGARSVIELHDELVGHRFLRRHDWAARF
jgi:hypothetical protein